MTTLEAETLRLARSYRGLQEAGRNTDATGEIDRWLAFSKARPGDPYCACFVSWCVLKAAVTEPPDFRRSAGALRLLIRNAELELTADSARMRLAADHPVIFVLDMGGGKGHAGFVEALGPGDLLHTLEANTGPGPAGAAADRDGQGVFERRDRRFASVVGWLEIR